MILKFAGQKAGQEKNFMEAYVHTCVAAYLSSAKQMNDRSNWMHLKMELNWKRKSSLIREIIRCSQNIAPCYSINETYVHICHNSDKKTVDPTFQINHSKVRAPLGFALRALNNFSFENGYLEREVNQKLSPTLIPILFKMGKFGHNSI